MRSYFNHKWIFIFCSIFVIFEVLLIWSTRQPTKTVVLINYHRSCIGTPINNTITLERLDNGDERPYKSNQQIFFLETTCSIKLDCVPQLTARHACAIESVARMHSHYNVYVLFFILGDVQVKGDNHLLRNVCGYDNVYLRAVNLTDYTKDTPLEEFITNKVYTQSHFINTHLSDALRLITLWKYGGMYLDNDIVCLKQFDPLGTNYVVAEARDSIMNAVINLGNDHLGHSILENCMNEMNATFDGKKWGYNGPGVITRVVSRLCNTNVTTNMTTEACQGLQVLPKETFLAVHYSIHLWFFNETFTTQLMNLLENSYVAHLFSHINNHIPVKKDSTVGYALLAKEYCPDMFNIDTPYF